MGTKNTVSVVSEGVTYFLSGPGTSNYTGSASPWTVESTSPYQLSMNDVTGNIWVPTPAPPVAIYGGGPPFSLGRRPIYSGYDNITESVGIQLNANTKDNAIALLNQLRNALTTARFSLPPILSVKGGTNTDYWEIYNVHVPENLRYLEEPDGQWRGTITWTRSPIAGAGTLTTLQSGITVTNSGTGANNNTRALGALTGDLQYEGAPLNIKLDPVTGGAYFYFGTVFQRTYSVAGAGATTTTSTGGTASWNDSTASISNPARTRNGLRLRVMVRVSRFDPKAQVRIQLISAQSSENLWIGPWVSAPGTTFPAQIDCTPQGVPLDFIRRALLTTGDVNVGMVVRSIDGSSVTVTTVSAEFLLYYTFCRVDVVNSQGGVGVAGLDFLQIEQAGNLNGTAYVPVPGSAYVVSTTGGSLASVATIRGTLPRAISGASLYYSWLTSAFAHTNTDTAVVTATLLPVYRSVRGNA